MKREISPGMMGVTIAIVVIVLGVFFYRKVIVNQPSAHPQMSYDTTGKPNAPVGAPGQDTGSGNTPSTSGGR